MDLKVQFENTKKHLLNLKQKTFGIKSENKGKIKNFFSQLSRGLMLPIAILPIAGLLLGIGGAIGANVPELAGQIVANILKGMSDVVFGNLPILFAVAITITFSKDKGASGFCSLLAFLVFSSSQLAFIQKDSLGHVQSILWFHQGNTITGITTTTLGFTTLQTSIFGGIIVGGLTSIIYNKFSRIKLPVALDFFSGVRLVPIILLPSMLVLALIFLIFWPWIGAAIYWMGSGIQGAPAGSGGLLYGILGRSLMPFGLHHIPIVLAFQTSFGGVLTNSTLSTGLINSGFSTNDQIYKTIMDAFSSFGGGIGNTTIEGDQNIWNFVNSLPYNSLLVNGVQTPIFEWFTKFTNTYPGRYTQDYPTYLGVCMGIGAALIMTSEKKNRRDISVVIGSAMLVAFLTGITEPLEFTFLFCAPWLYYLIYVPLSGFSYMFMELLGAHVGVGFARGFIDLIIYGAIPVLKGTNFYWAFVLALVEGLFSFFVFWACIKYFNIQTPGRGNNPMNLITKKDYQKLKEKDSSSSLEEDTDALEPRIVNLIYALGGADNIKDVTSCATRLRVNVVSTKNLEKSDFLNLGSKGEIFKDCSLQIIFGGEASILADKINDLLSSECVIPLQTKDDNEFVSTKNTDKKLSKQIVKFNVIAPMDGKIVYLDKVPDEAFKSKLLGDGLAIIPNSGCAYSPIENGKVTYIANSKHCYVFTPKDNSIGVMIHFGIDSITNSQNIFKSNLMMESDVDKNSKIATINLKELSKCKSNISPITIPDLDEMKAKLSFNVKHNQIVKRGDILMTISK